MYYYPHHIGDFIADTSRLSDSQCMAYLRLIWHYYDTEKPLENDPDSLAFKIGANASDVLLILKHYFILDGGVWKKTRCDNVISEYHGKSDKARKSAELRWKNAKAMQSDSERNANASENNANATKNDANQEPITNNQNNKKNTAGKPSVSLSSWLEKIKAEGQSPIPESDPIFDYASDAGIPLEYLRATWVEFKTEFTEKTDKKKDWRAHFRNFVRKNYYSLWWLDNGEYKLTSRGQQAVSAMNNRDKREAQ